MTASLLALQAVHLHKDFRGFTATNDVTLDVHEGEIHAVIGPNGAGKTTLFNLLSGFLKPTSGEVRLFGERVDGLPPEVLVRRGLSRSFQISSVFPSMTLRENLAVALQAPTRLPRQFWTSERALAQFDARIEQILEEVGLSELQHRLAADLSHGEKRGLEIGLSLTQDPKVLLLDEPTSGMGSEGVRAGDLAGAAGRSGPHRRDGRAQHERGGATRRPHHGLAVRAGDCQRSLRAGAPRPRA